MGHHGALNRCLAFCSTAAAAAKWAGSLTRVPLAEGKSRSQGTRFCAGVKLQALQLYGQKQGNHVANLWVRSGKIEGTAEETLSQIASVERILSLALAKRSETASINHGGLLSCIHATASFSYQLAGPLKWTGCEASPSNHLPVTVSDAMLHW